MREELEDCHSSIPPSIIIWRLTDYDVRVGACLFSCRVFALVISAAMTVFNSIWPLFECHLFTKTSPLVVNRNSDSKRYSVHSYCLYIQLNVIKIKCTYVGQDFDFSVIHGINLESVEFSGLYLQFFCKPVYKSLVLFICLLTLLTTQILRPTKLQNIIHSLVFFVWVISILKPHWSCSIWSLVPVLNLSQLCVATASSLPYSWVSWRSLQLTKFFLKIQPFHIKLLHFILLSD